MIHDIEQKERLLFVSPVAVRFIAEAMCEKTSLRPSVNGPLSSVNISCRSMVSIRVNNL